MRNLRCQDKVLSCPCGSFASEDEAALEVKANVVGAAADDQTSEAAVVARSWLVSMPSSKQRTIPPKKKCPLLFQRRSHLIGSDIGIFFFGQMQG